MATVLEPLELLIIQPVGQHTSTVIFLHGLGASGDDLEDVARALARKFPNIKWILPSARFNPVTLNRGMIMPSWFDILCLPSLDAIEDEEGMLSAAKDIDGIITTEVESGIPASRIVLAGLSQGCALGLLTGLTTKWKLAGIVALSGRLPFRKKMKTMMSDHAREVPLFWAHGTRDPLVDISLGREAVRVLNDELEFKSVTFKQYPIVHCIDPMELVDLALWLEHVLPVEGL